MYPKLLVVVLPPAAWVLQVRVRRLSGLPVATTVLACSIRDIFVSNGA